MGPWQGVTYHHPMTFTLFRAVREAGTGALEASDSVSQISGKLPQCTHSGISVAARTMDLPYADRLIALHFDGTELPEPDGGA